MEDALRAVTIDAARQLFMEDKVGSLEAGKAADLAVVSKNPLEIKPDRLDQIRVLDTYRGGRKAVSIA
ncbi:MAG: amidohydrolase family protein [Deltaproteobacteria bacterium]|nr:amidohydrolase family protein [Deltaproteobacteria bacterium]MBW1816204.1 amidohydrolase family protein [Deltaproteobacteria bacterium]